MDINLSHLTFESTIVTNSHTPFLHQAFVVDKIKLVRQHSTKGQDRDPNRKNSHLMDTHPKNIPKGHMNFGDI